MRLQDFYIKPKSIYTVPGFVIVRCYNKYEGMSFVYSMN